MPRHLSVGRVAGVRIGCTPALLLAALLLVVVAVNGGHVAVGSIAGPGAVVLGSLLAHELGHGLVARAHGFEIDGVVLGLAGGVVAYSGEAPEPAVAIRIAAAGPFVSGVLACILAAALTLAPEAGSLSHLLQLGAWANLANAVVNLLPLPSLDGARIGAAVLEQRRERLHVARNRPIVVERP